MCAWQCSLPHHLVSLVLLTGCSHDLGEGHRPQLSIPGDALASLLEAPSSQIEGFLSQASGSSWGTQHLVFEGVAFQG